MSRSIGDTIASSVGVISEPEIISYEINEAVSAIIMASDGVWEFLENSQVFELIKPSLEKKNPELGCKTLIKVSRKFWKSEDVTVDDITVLLIYFV